MTDFRLMIGASRPVRELPEYAYAEINMLRRIVAAYRTIMRVSDTDPLDVKTELPWALTAVGATNLQLDAAAVRAVESLEVNTDAADAGDFRAHAAALHVQHGGDLTGIGLREGQWPWQHFLANDVTLLQNTGHSGLRGHQKAFEQPKKKKGGRRAT